MQQTLVKEVMSGTPHIVNASASLRDAAKLMETYECGSLPVRDGEVLIGILTDRDIVIFGLAVGKDPDTACVESIISGDVYTCYDTDTLERAADILAEQEVRRLVVVNNQERVVGIISATDMIKSASRDVVDDNVMHHLFRYA